LTYHTQKGNKLLNIMRITMASTVVILATFAGFIVDEPVIGLLALFAAIMFLKADWSR
jgi:hypothetical protein